MKTIKRSLLGAWLLLLILALAACDGDSPSDTDDDFDTGGGGLGTPSGTTVGDIVDEQPTLQVTPMITDEVDIEATPIITDMVTIEPTEALTPTAEATATQEVMATEVATATAVVPAPAPITGTETMTTVTQAILASDLVGMDITNEEGEEVGEVGELLINADGTVQYVIFDVGGFLGIGERSIAVTWDEMEIQLKDDVDLLDDDEEINTDDLTVRYMGAAANLEELPEFDTSILDEDGYILGEDDDLDDDFDATPYMGLLQVGEFQDYNLINSAGEDLGEVEDLIIDLTEGQVIYAVVDFGGFLGIGETSVAVPWDHLELNITDDTETFMLDVDQTELEEAPLFNFDDWTYPVREGWDALDIHPYWETR